MHVRMDVKYLSAIMWQLLRWSVEHVDKRDTRSAQGLNVGFILLFTIILLLLLIIIIRSSEEEDDGGVIIDIPEISGAQSSTNSIFLL